VKRRGAASADSTFHPQPQNRFCDPFTSKAS
jgi:hypothetical protein